MYGGLFLFLVIMSYAITPPASFDANFFSRGGDVLVLKDTHLNVGGVGLYNGCKAVSMEPSEIG